MRQQKLYRPLAPGKEMMHVRHAQRAVDDCNQMPLIFTFQRAMLSLV